MVFQASLKYVRLRNTNLDTFWNPYEWLYYDDLDQCLMLTARQYLHESAVNRDSDILPVCRSSTSVLLSVFVERQ